MLLMDAHTPYIIVCFMLMAIGFGMAFNMPAMTTACIEAAPRERSSIASGVLNAGRQAGSALGVALLGSLVVGRGNAFVSGMHVALIIAGGVFLLASVLSFFAVREIKGLASTS
jgi:DHA2 family methylenomycin A resistance protein-like MFS transporter